MKKYKVKEPPLKLVMKSDLSYNDFDRIINYIVNTIGKEENKDIIFYYEGDSKKNYNLNNNDELFFLNIINIINQLTPIQIYLITSKHKCKKLIKKTNFKLLYMRKRSDKGKNFRDEVNSLIRLLYPKENPYIITKEIGAEYYNATEIKLERTK